MDRMGRGWGWESEYGRWIGNAGMEGDDDFKRNLGRRAHCGGQEEGFTQKM